MHFNVSQRAELYQKRLYKGIFLTNAVQRRKFETFEKSRINYESFEKFKKTAGDQIWINFRETLKAKSKFRQ
jgi:hypothetical protein